ncbi:MAG: fructosamine kinase family protein [Gammaproteobacteria bacterium]
MSLLEVTGELEHLLGTKLSLSDAKRVGGGSINDAYRVSTDRGPLFLKLNSAVNDDMFEAEVDGLRALREARSIIVPEVLAYGVAADTAFLALEWLNLGRRSAMAEAALGVALARQHRVVSERFGWHRDNYIGLTRQPNDSASDWVAFYRDTRLGFQLKLAVENNIPAAIRKSIEQLLNRIGEYFGEEAVPPSLLHGDLWAGNWGTTADGQACIFDPAVYFGDREADLAMTRLFGGYGRDFYMAYEAEWPLASGWERRVDLYNLYHLLNHFNLFGEGYLSQVTAALNRLTD